MTKHNSRVEISSRVNSLDIRSTPISTDRPRVRGSGLIAAALICQVILLSIVGWHNWFVLSPDAISYIRIALYYARGQTDLMVSGYWGPLLSWLMVPLLWLGADPLCAARIVTGFSAVVYLFGCVSLFRSLQLHWAGVVLGTWLAAMAAVAVTSDISPDILMAGLLCLGISRMLSPQWLTQRSAPLTAGLLCGVAYLAKAVVLPTVFVLCIGISGMWVMSRMCNITSVLRSVALTVLSFALVAIPWVVTLSVHYKYPTFTTSGKINHALMGPTERDQIHPFGKIYHIPEPGRITVWEDPSNMPYRYWSPLESPQNAKHQLWVIYKNYRSMLDVFHDFDALGISGFALIGCLLHRQWRRRLSLERWRWSGVLVACLCSVYLPVFALAHRYYAPVYPLLVAASLGLVGRLTHSSRAGHNLPRLLGCGLVVCSFAAPTVVNLSAVLGGIKEPHAYAYTLADKLQAANIHGALAGVDGNEGLPVAFFMNQPWYGSEQNPTLEKIKASQANIIIISRGSFLKSILENDSNFRNLDSIIFKDAEEAIVFPFKAYQRIVP